MSVPMLIVYYTQKFTYLYYVDIMFHDFWHLIMLWHNWLKPIDSTCMFLNTINQLAI